MAALDLSLPPSARSSQLWTLATRQCVAIFVPVVASPFGPASFPALPRYGCSTCLKAVERTSARPSRCVMRLPGIDTLTNNGPAHVLVFGS
jgi:hypothetical protein